MIVDIQEIKNKLMINQFLFKKTINNNNKIYMKRVKTNQKYKKMSEENQIKMRNQK